MSSIPEISVIIPAYNHEKYVGQTVESVLCQSYENFELIIINDGSMDNTESEIQKFTDSRILYNRQENQGAHVAINHGIKLSKGKYIAILNSDDLYVSNRLEECRRLLQDNKEYSAVVTQLEGIDGKNRSVADNTSPHILAWKQWYADALALFDDHDFHSCCFAKNILITTSNYFMKRDVFTDVGYFRGLRYAHDWDFLIRLAQRHKVHLMDQVLLKYRIHDENTVHEDDSKYKVDFEVNWLIAEGILNLDGDLDYFQLIGLLQRNHYLNFELLVLMLMLFRKMNAEDCLDFSNSSTIKMLKLLSRK